MKTIGIVVLGACFLASAASADDVTFEFIGIGYATDISADGSVVVGNTQADYETFRWTEETGIVLLGLPTVPFLGVGAGGPEVSGDGTRVSATILGADSSYVTQGLWTEGSGWMETMPPVPADGGLIDNSYGSAWGLSEDGTALVGFYWRPGNGGPDGDGLAHASRWTESTGIVDLGSVKNSRANEASGDGSVVVGWHERFDGVWQPTAWIDGVRITLADTDIFAEANIVNPAGTIIAGQDKDPTTQKPFAAVWRWNGTDWVQEMIGALPNTFRLAQPTDMTPDGSTIIGYNEFTNPLNATGFIWTAETGMVDVEDYLADNGVVVDPNFDIRSLSGISDDGRILVGLGQDRTSPFTNRSFIIRITDPASVEPGEVASVRSLRVWPNPTRDRSEFSLDLVSPGEVRVDVFDPAGRLIRHLFDGSLDAGRKTFDWDGTSRSGIEMPSGIYHYRISVDGRTESKKLILAR